jgi:VWA domain-containing protein
VLARAPEAVQLEEIKRCIEHKDSFVRRGAYELLAAVRTREAVDALVARLPEEIGRPQQELIVHLSRISRRKHGQSLRAWAEWWAGARARWERPEVLADAEAGGGKAMVEYFGLKLESARVMFVLDTSGSMDWRMNVKEGMLASRADRSLPRKIERARAELIRAIESLDESCRFSIVTYGTKTDAFNRRLLPASEANQKRARKWIEDIRPDGVTNLSEAVLRALDATTRGASPRDDDIADTLVILSDGEPNCGPLPRRDDFLEEVRRRNPGGMIRIHTVFLGADSGTGVMQRLAAQNAGQFVHHTR